MSERQVGRKLTIIRREEYVGSKREKHVFLVGDLERPNPHPFIRDHRVEWILCFYQPGDDGIPHWHSEITEYEIVLEGEVGYLEIATGETTWFRAGDFSVIPPGVCVRRIVRQPASTIALKVPSSAERVVCSECPRECTRRIEPYLGGPKNVCE